MLILMGWINHQSCRWCTIRLIDILLILSDEPGSHWLWGMGHQQVENHLLAWYNINDNIVNNNEKTLLLSAMNSGCQRTKRLYFTFQIPIVVSWMRKGNYYFCLVQNITLTKYTTNLWDLKSSIGTLQIMIGELYTPWLDPWVSIPGSE